MEIKSFNELNALYRLLVKIKTSDKLDSDDIDLFAGSPFINDILKRVNHEYLPMLKEQYNSDAMDKWWRETKFNCDDEMGKAIKGRILNWEGATIANLKGKNAEDYYEIAKAYVEPFNFEQSELQKLANFIEMHVNSSN